MEVVVDARTICRRFSERRARPSNQVCPETKTIVKKNKYVPPDLIMVGMGVGRIGVGWVYLVCGG